MSLILRQFTRTTRPDPSSLAAAIAPLLTTAGGFFLSYDDFAQKLNIEYGDWTGVNTAAVQNAVTAAAPQTDRTDAQEYIDNMPLAERANYLTILDQVNLIRSKLVPALGAITPAQYIAAVKAKADTL